MFITMRETISTGEKFATMSNEDKLKAIMEDATYQAKLPNNGFASTPIDEDNKQLYSKLVFKLSDENLSKEETFKTLNQLFDLYEGKDVPAYKLVASAKRAFASRRYDLTEFVNDRFLGGKAKIAKPVDEEASEETNSEVEDAKKLVHELLSGVNKALENNITASDIVKRCNNHSKQQQNVERDYFLHLLWIQVIII